MTQIHLNLINFPYRETLSRIFDAYPDDFERRLCPARPSYLVTVTQFPLIYIYSTQDKFQWDRVFLEAKIGFSLVLITLLEKVTVNTH